MTYTTNAWDDPLIFQKALSYLSERTGMIYTTESALLIWNDPVIKGLRYALCNKWDMVEECEKWRGKFVGTPGRLIEEIWEYEEKWARFCQSLLAEICRQKKKELENETGKIRATIREQAIVCER